MEHACTFHTYGFLYTSIVLGRRGGLSGEEGEGLMGGCTPCVYHALFCLLADRIFGMPGFLPTKISVQMVGHGMD